MTTRKPSWKTLASKRIGRTAIFRGGNGPFAFVTPCGKVVFTLFQTRAEAEKRKAKIDKVACGAACCDGRRTLANVLHTEYLTNTDEAYGCTLMILAETA